MAEKAKSAWDKIKQSLNKSISEPDDDDPVEDGDPTNEGGDEVVDATEVLEKAISKIEALEGTIEVMATAMNAVFEKLEQSAVMQKSVSEGILALMQRTEEVIASPSPRKGAVTQLETLQATLNQAALAKSQGAGADPVTPKGGLKPFTKEKLDMCKDILIKAVADKEIDVFESGRFETHMNKSIGRASYSFPADMEAFFRKKLA